MRNIIFHTMNLNQNWILEILENELHPNQKVSFLILDEDPLFAQDNITLQKSTRFKNYIDVFKRFGIDDIQIYFLESLSIKEFKDVVNASDTIVLIRNPELSISYIDEMHKDIIKDFDGLLIGVGYGGLAQLEEYEDEDGYHEGFGVLEEMHILYDFNQDQHHLSKALTALEMSDHVVVALPIESGLLLDGEYFEMLGNGFVLSTNDMDDLYQALQTLQKW